MKTIETKAGDHISKVAFEACSLAKECLQPVHFVFNEVEVDVCPGDEAAGVVEVWQKRFDQKCRDFENSKEGKQVATDKAQSIATARRKNDYLLEELYVGSTYPKAEILVRILADLADAAHVGVPMDYQYLAGYMEQAGYKENEYVGHTPASDFKTNRVICARYIIGQAINCMKMGMPPHPLTRKFYEDFTKIPLVV